MARDRILERNKNVRGLSQGRGEQGGGSHCTWTALHENVVGQTGRGSRKREPYRAIIAHRCGVARARETVSGRGPQDTGVHGAVFQ